MGASAGVLLLGGAAMLYQAYYKARVLKKMEAAFDGGYDPVLALVENGKEMAYVSVHPPRPEEELIDSIIGGNERGRYFLILGSKGSGKSTMIIQAMSRHKAEGCAFFEAHPDPSIVVDRFSEAINFRCVPLWQERVLIMAELLTFVFTLYHFASQYEQRLPR